MPRLMKFLLSLPATYNQWRLTFLFLYFFETYRRRSVFLDSILSTKLSFRILLFSASRAHQSQEGLWWTESSCSGV